MSLKEYNKKRDFKKTPEPSGAAARSTAGRQFVVQKHAASRLHYDFRLELDGTLKSWAVPKGPSLDPSVKALAVQVEDHPLDYASFEGVIPKGEYGGGAVMVWDQGTWEPEGDGRRDFKKGRLKFRLYGDKLQGSWALVRMHGKAGDGGKNWLLIKHDDETAKPTKKYDVLVKQPRSVLSDRTIDEIAAAADRVWSSRNGSADESSEGKSRSAKKAKKKSKPSRDGAAPDPSDVKGARKAKQPTVLKPQLATLAAAAPRGDQWVHELKFDGYRMLAFIKGGAARLVTRRGQDWSHRFPKVVRACEGLGLNDAVLDGEVVALDERGISSFQRLQNQLRRGDDHALAYYVFDLPHFGGYDLTAATLAARKDLLEKLLDRQPDDAVVRYSEHLQADGDEVRRQACDGDLEGIISKRLDSPYRQARSPHWRKIKCSKRQEFVIGGYTKPSGSRTAFGALLLGVYEDGRLRYSGKVGTGFTEQSLRDLMKELKTRRIDQSPFDPPPARGEQRGLAAWVAPELVAEVQFTEWTDDGLLRHPSFQGLREDKPANYITRDEPRPMKVKESSSSASKRGRSSTAKQRPARARDAEVAGVRLTHPDRVLYPGQGVTKRDLAEFYVEISDYILPHVVGRPMTLVRCPAGQTGQCFYQKHLTGELPKGLRGVMIKEKHKREEYVVIENISGLVSLVQMGALEFHPWPARADRLERPDQLVFDLDPGEGVAWKAVVQAARDVRECLAAIGLESFLRVSGGKGLHVVAPLDRRSSWDQFKAFAKGVANAMVEAAPDRYTATLSKAKRKGKVFVDYLRNQRGATAVASYSTRARAGAPVAVPIAWDELSAKTTPNMFTVKNLPAHLAKRAEDPWAAMSGVRQSITKAMERALQI